MNHSNSVTPGVAGANPAHTPTHEQIAALAFSLHLKHGRPHGRAWEDWLEAERLLLQLPARPEDSSHKVSTHLIEHPHARDERHSPSRGEIRQMNTGHRPASRASQRPAG